jgi:hypothetical protein
MQLSIFRVSSTFHFIKETPFFFVGERGGKDTGSGPNFTDRGPINDKGFTE